MCQENCIGTIVILLCIHLRICLMDFHFIFYPNSFQK
uniref:Uncharacterized protein n=1 Tax=Tetranychus urticae TaxID=32264 RepID=T1K112_TETUR